MAVDQQDDLREAVSVWIREVMDGFAIEYTEPCDIGPSGDGRQQCATHEWCFDDGGRCIVQSAVYLGLISEPTSVTAERSA